LLRIEPPLFLLRLSIFFSSEIYCEDLNINPEIDCLGFHGKNYQPYQEVKNKYLIDLLDREKANYFSN
jgi:hypothetical protein